MAVGANQIEEKRWKDCDWPRVKKVYNDNSLRRQVIEFYRYGPSGEEIKWKMNRTGFLPPQE